MTEAQLTQQQPSRFKIFMNNVKAFFQNETFLYILKRILSSLITLVLLAALVTLLIRMLPDEMFYDSATYRKLIGINEETGRRYLNFRLYLAGRKTIRGEDIPVLFSIGKFIYYILPIYKEVPWVYNDIYTEVLVYWKGFCYFGMNTKDQIVTGLIANKMGISFTISIISTFGTYLFAIPLGVAMAKKPGGVVDKIGNVFIVLNYAIPALVFYLIMNRIGGYNWGLGWSYDPEDPIRTLTMPLACIIFLSIPGLSIWIRRFMVDELSSDYVKFARSKGLSENTIMYKHVFRNAIVPLVRNLPATFIGAIIGSYFIETIWSIDGTGKLLIKAMDTGHPEAQVIQGLTIIYAAMSMISFLLGDIVTIFFDPRIKLHD